MRLGVCVYCRGVPGAEVFISYSRADWSYVQRLADALGRHTFDVWYDRKIEPGATFSAEIARHIRTSAAMIVILSPPAVRSPWVEREVSFAIDAGVPILPVLLEPCDKFLLTAGLQEENVVGGRMPGTAFLTRLANLVAASALSPVGFDIDQYLRELDRLFTESHAGNWSVPLRGDVGDSLEVDVDVEGYIDEWLQRPAPGPLAVLGDYGTGKSWLCLRVAKALADRYRQDPSRPLPLLITFKRFEQDMDLEQLVHAHLFDGYAVRVDHPPDLMRALRSGALLPILDGLDEMVRSLGGRTALVAYSRLGLTNEIPRAIITCRTHYFYSGSEQRELLAPKTVLPRFEILHLRLLSPTAVEAGVRRRLDPSTAEPLLRFIKSTYNLTDLCARPILLSLVCQSREHLPDVGGAASSADLYEAYTDAWLHRELRSGRLILPPNLVVEFFEDLAESLVKRNSMLVFEEQIQQRLTDVLERAALLPERWREVERQLITSTFVTRVHGSAWQFAHRSFQEYFYARKFFRWESQTSGEGEFPVLYAPIWQFIAQMTTRRWDEQKARQWIVPRARRDEDPTLTRTTLRAAAAYWLLANGRRDFPSAGIMLDTVDLRNSNLASFDLTGADLNGSDLSGSDLSSAVLRGCNLAEARVEGCDIAGADFRGADFGSGRTLDELTRCPGYDSARFSSASSHRRVARKARNSSDR